VQWSAVGLTAFVITALGVYGYFAPADVRIRTSIWQIVVLMIGLVATFVLDLLLMRGARTVAQVRWGTLPRRGQYVLIMLAFVIVWLMALMGYARSGVRLNWHVYGIVQDTSPGAGLPSLGEVAIIITAITFVFFVLLAAAFAISGLARAPDVRASAAAPVPEPGGA
ncbi:MAG: hypothetical protein IT518_28090, partial [Burkholderiales bacterium]|nr:hypothetical protein [Burkholderiales bacterium]